MPKQVLHGRLLRWGHTKGIRLPTKEAARVDIPLGTELRVTLEAVPAALEPGEMMTVHGTPDDSISHDRILAEAHAAKRKRR